MLGDRSEERADSKSARGVKRGALRGVNRSADVSISRKNTS